jgi:Flp pilus assembly protein TadG
LFAESISKKIQYKEEVAVMKTVMDKLAKRIRQPVGGLRKDGKEGQALVEFALALPFIILLFVVLVELAFLIRGHLTAVSAVREGVRSVSQRGNADPSAVFFTTSGGSAAGANDIANRVGADGDTVLVQNMNTALQDMRKKVTMLMTYRADYTEGISQTATGAAQQVGINGIGGEAGIYYNPTVSRLPFQQVFSYTMIAGERWFTPTVLSQEQCDALYTGVQPAAARNVATSAGKKWSDTYGFPTFCGDASKTGANQGIDRRVPLGQVYLWQNQEYNNATVLSSKNRYTTPSGGTAQCAANQDVGRTKQAIFYWHAIQCTRYAVAPWYPSIRRAHDVPVTNPSTARTDPNYYNNQTEASFSFGCPTPADQRSPDYVGIWVNYRHDWFLSFFPGFLNLSEKSVKIMEPVGNGYSPPTPPQHTDATKNPNAVSEASNIASQPQCV